MSSSSGGKSAATRTLQIAADIAPRAALLVAAAKMGTSDAAIEEVLTTPRAGATSPPKRGATRK